jgi:hypothetical protein
MHERRIPEGSFLPGKVSERMLKYIIVKAGITQVSWEICEIKTYYIEYYKVQA